MASIILGTGNAHKLREMQALLPGYALEPLPAGLEAAPETGRTFAENARQKAEHYARLLGRQVLADDSGLCVNALKGAPGIYSARYAGPGAMDAQNLKLLLANLQGVTRREARFVCALSLADPGGELVAAEGFCEGTILEAPDGEGGFGYDPVFLSKDLGVSFARAEAGQKNAVSHRARACKLLAGIWPVEANPCP
ncbi:MAG: RdgB/HAM1 family non-canonical purine NTP pyrophosphatase [Planctomycetota bacterium]